MKMKRLSTAIILISLTTAHAVMSEEITRFPLCRDCRGTRPSFKVSAGGTHLIMLCRKGYDTHIQVNERYLGKYSNNPKVFFSPDGKRFAITASRKSDRYVITPDKTYGPYDYADMPVFRPDDNSLMFYHSNERFDPGSCIARSPGNSYCSNQGCCLISHHVNFRPTRSLPHLVVKGKEYDRESEKWRSLIDEYEALKTRNRKPGTDVAPPQRPAPLDRNGKKFITMDGQTYGPYDNIWAINYCSRSGRFFFAYTMKDEINGRSRERNFVQMKDRSFGPVVFYSNPESSHNSMAFDFSFWKERPHLPSAEHSREQYLQVNDDTYGPMTGRGKVFYSRDGSHYIFKFWKRNRAWVQVRGKTFGPYAKVFDCRISPDGKRYAFFYETGGKRYFRQNNNIIKGGGEFIINPENERRRNTHNVYDQFLSYSETLMMARVNGVLHAGTLRINNIDYISDEVRDIMGNSYGYRMVTHRRNRDDPGEYVLVNGRAFGPYQDVSTPVFNRKGSLFTFSFRTGEKEYMWFREKTIGPFRCVSRFMGINSGALWFQYCGGDEGSMTWINGKSYGPYWGAGNPVISRNGSFAMLCNTKDNKHYLQTNIQKYGPLQCRDSYCKEYQPAKTKRGIKFRLNESGKEYVIYNSRKFGPYMWGDVIEAKDGSTWLVYIDNEEKLEDDVCMVCLDVN